MATNKKRKLQASEPPQVMSAFALRKRLLNQPTSAALAKVETADEHTSVPPTPEIVETSRTTRARSPKKGKKILNIQSTPDQENENDISPEVSLPDGMSAAGNIDIAPNSPIVPTKSPSPAIGDDEVPVEPSRALPVQLSNFRPSKSNYRRRKDGRIALKLSDGERLVILGSYGIHVTSGEITVNGAVLKSSDRIHWVDAPHCHALPVLRCSDGANLELLSHPGALDLRSLGRLSPQFRKLWNNPDCPPDKGVAFPDSTFQILYTSADGPRRAALQDLVSPPEWNKEISKFIVASNSKPCSFMITGPKSSGKSTFGKILANRLITNQSSSSRRRAHRGVAILDLDPGQPEYCVAGQVALVHLTEPVFGPSFCRPLSCPEYRIVRSHALASVSPASDPELYLEAAIDLMTHYRNTLGSYTLIINTPGWIQGTGLDLLTSLNATLKPSEVVYMSESGPAEVVEALQESCKATNFSTLPSQASQLTSRTAAQLRSMQTMSYFHTESQSVGADGRIIWNTKPLTTVPPWQVSYTGLNRGIFGIMCYDYQVPLDLLADAINGTILAVVGVECVKAFRYHAENEGSPNNAAIDIMDVDIIDNGGSHDSMPSSFSDLAEKIIATTPEGIPFIDTANGTTLDPKYSHSLGLVLVRGIDVENSVLQLLTPLSAERIEEVTSRGGQIVLVSGKFDIPSWAYTEELYYRAQGEVDDGANLDELVDTDGGTGDISEAENDGFAESTEAAPVPWVEVLHGNQRRGVGSKVWRVRRDLGRMGNVTN